MFGLILLISDKWNDADNDDDDRLFFLLGTLYKVLTT